MIGRRFRINDSRMMNERRHRQMKQNVAIARSFSSATDLAGAPQRDRFSLVRQVLQSPGYPLEGETRDVMEKRFAHDFAKVRIHTDERAGRSADAIEANAYTVGNHIAFGPRQFNPITDLGRHLLAHELTHTIQQSDRGHDRLSLAKSDSPLETEAERAGKEVDRGRPVNVSKSGERGIARQAKTEAKTESKGEEKEEEAKPVVGAGTPVSRIIVDLRSGRVGFAVPAPQGYILGTVSTDLRPGQYKVSPDPSKQQWIFKAGQVKSGLRFHVELEGADPWSLSYPDELIVSVGFSSGKKGGGPSGQTPQDADADLIRIFDEAGPGNIPEDPSIDGFVDFVYDPQIIEGTGKFSPFVTLRFLDGSEEQISIDTIDEGTEKPANAVSGISATGRTVPAKLNCATTPNLCSMRKAIKRTQQVLLEKWDAELLSKELETFPQVFSVLAQVGIIGANAKAFEITGKPANARGGLRGTGSKAAVEAAKRVKPLNGTVNVGGGLEEGAEQVTNLNPIKPGTGGPTKGIPNHVKAGFEEMDQVFEPGSVQKVISRKLTSSTVDWPRAAQATAKVMAPGGKVRLNVWQLGEQDSALIKEAFEKAGFKNVKVLGKGSSVVLADW